jgi:hypothetical protein
MAHKNTQALADLLDDLTPEQLTDLVFNLWVRGQITRGDIKGFRIGIGKPVAEEFNDQYIDKRA